MLKKIVVTNFRNESIEYDIEGVQAENESGLLITSIDGLGPVKATINMTDIPTSDGSVFNSARLNSRNIVIKAKFTSASSIEEARHLSYRYFPVKSKVKIQVVTDTRTVETEGYVESNEPDIFYEMSGCQISIVCPSAFMVGNDIHEEFDLLTGKCDVNFHGDNNDGVSVKVNVIDNIVSMSLSKEFGPGSVIGEMTMDFERMSNIVPNESPTEVPYGKCSFYFSNNKKKYLVDLPVEAKAPYEKTVSGNFVYGSLSFAGVYRKNGDKSIHIFSIERKKNGDYTPPRTNVRSMAHYRMDHISHKWEKLTNPTFPQLGGWTNPYISIIWIGYCGSNDQIYMLARIQSDLTLNAYNNSAFFIFRLNEATNGWVVANQCLEINQSGVIPEPKSCIAYSMNNRIYILYGSFNTPRFVEYSPDDGIVCFRYLDDVATESGTTIPWGFPISNEHTLLAADESINTLHVFKTSAGGSYSDYRHVTIHPVENVSPSSSGYLEIKEIIDSDYEEYNDPPNVFFNTSAANGRILFVSRMGYFCWYKLTSEYTGTYADRTDVGFVDPNIFYSSFGDGLEDIYYLVGCATDDGQAPPAYSEAPTNTKLIDEDVLTISTIKGEKGIILNRHGVKYNIMNVVSGKIPWFTLGPDINEFTLVVNGPLYEEEKVRISEASVDSKELFEGA